MKSYYIYLYRNGLTDSNLEGKYIGHTDVPLSENGIKQIEQMKQIFAEQKECTLGWYGRTVKWNCHM